jgi:hypothetical protein
LTLAKSKLKGELVKFMDPNAPGFTGFFTDFGATADAWANAYDLYASDATDASGDAIASKNKAAFKSALQSGLAASSSAAAAALAFDAAFIAYWTGATFSVGVPPPPAGPGACANAGGTGVMLVEVSSVVTVITPLVLSAALASVFASLGTDGDAKATAIADAFDTATKSAVAVLITGTDPLAVPVLNLCTVF